VICLLERAVRIGNLFAFYEELLTERQQEMIRLYFYHDLSLGEIADEYSISRQAVYDNLQRAEAALEDYEAKLGLVKKHKKNQVKVKKLANIVDKIANQIDDKEVKSLLEIVDDLGELSD